MAHPSLPIFDDIRRPGLPTDVGMFWEPRLEDLITQIREVEADRAARLVSIQEIWADRDGWIDKYNALDRQVIELMQERGHLMQERDHLIHYRDDVIRQRDRLTVERDVLLHARTLLANERDAYMVERRGLIEDYDALSEDRGAVEKDRDRLAAEIESLRDARQVEFARAEAAQRKLDMLKRFSPWRFVPVSLKLAVGRRLGRMRQPSV